MPDAALEEAKAERWHLVKVLRAQAEDSGCRAPLGVVDTDLDARLRVSGAVTMALIAQAAGQPFSIDWTMRDNGSVTHDAAAMIAMGVVVGQHVAACHEAAKAKRQQIDAAETIEAVHAVSFSEGWPDAS